MYNFRLKLRSLLSELSNNLPPQLQKMYATVVWKYRCSKRTDKLLVNVFLPRGWSPLSRNFRVDWKAFFTRENIALNINRMLRATNLLLCIFQSARKIEWKSHWVEITLYKYMLAKFSNKRIAINEGMICQRWPNLVMLWIIFYNWVKRNFSQN